jgi:hypothetical protein
MANTFFKLGYSFDDPNGDIKQLSANTQSHLDSMPAFVNDWQSGDMANNSVNGYFKNPVGPTANMIYLAANTVIEYCANANGLQGSTATITNLFADIAAANITSICTDYSNHTDRLSGVTDFTDYITTAGSSIASGKPFLKTAMSLGKMVMYITYQTDGIINSAPILGSFTSLFIGPQINVANTIIQNYPALVNNSITFSNDANGNLIATSSLSLGEVLTIKQQFANTAGYINTRITHDENFYTNTKIFVNELGTVRQFTSMGETEKLLANNYIGTDKLLSRINS